jgi:hypothetical protein
MLLPSFIAMQFDGQNFGDERRCFGCGDGIEQQGASSPGQDIFDRASHFFPGSPDGLFLQVRKPLMQRFAEVGFGSGQFGNLSPVSAINGEMPRWRKVFGLGTTSVERQGGRSRRNGRKPSEFGRRDPRKSRVPHCGISVECASMWPRIERRGGQPVTLRVRSTRQLFRGLQKADFRLLNSSFERLFHYLVYLFTVSLVSYQPALNSQLTAIHFWLAYLHKVPT